ncbi:mediator of DNA damage checkpoint protein 1 isoform X4 [Rhinatrema bivittatum]|uniref:mediator of DNA damage checkpoint protein 1 isoform X3 n=1 Tax=Rhinatrema bivittatum TaxID=194408 RepID=UPI00112CBC36|nr:mediator of DNA damage checkpoint protein 1 isoform X3 [Rhinatrema bivittatum]XP_029440719.1 mediator of DNA damage checkpoint protein 1 isoform X4 [Rhinatrema bivittatum]
MEQTQPLDWDAENLGCETLESKDGNQEPVGRLHVFSSSYGPEKDFWIHFGENSIGRQDTCHVAIPAPSISKQHAVIEAEAEGSHLIYDCGSLNRTRRRKSALKPHARYALEDGDLLLFADVACQYFILPQPSENGAYQANVAGQGLRRSLCVRESDSDDSILVPGTQGCPALPLVIEKTPAVGAARKMGYGGVLAKDSDDESEEGDRSWSHPHQGERGSRESSTLAEGRHALGSTVVSTPAASTVIPESDAEEVQETPAGKDQEEPQPKQQTVDVWPERIPQDLFHLDSDTDVEDEDSGSERNWKKGSSCRRTQRSARRDWPGTSQAINTIMEGKGAAEMPPVGLKKSRRFSPELDSETDTEGDRTERSSVGQGNNSNTSTDQDSDTDVERERERRDSAGEGDSRQSDTDMDGDVMERPAVGEGDSRRPTADQDSDTDVEGEGMERSDAGEGDSRQTATNQDSDTDMEGEGTKRPDAEEEGIGQATANQDRETDVEGDETERPVAMEGGIRQDSDTNVDRERTEGPDVGEGGIRQATADWDSVTVVEGEGTERLAAGEDGIRQSSAKQDSDTNVDEEGSKRPGAGEESMRQPCAQQVINTDVEAGLSIAQEDHSTPVEQQSCRRSRPFDANTDSEEDDTDGSPRFALQDTQCYLYTASKVREEEMESSVAETEEEDTQVFASRPSTSVLFKKPFFLRPSEGFLPSAGFTSLEKAEDWPDDQLVMAETQPFCNNPDLNAISSRSGAESAEMEPTQAFPQKGDSEEVSQEETQPIALYLSLRAASEPPWPVRTTPILKHQAVSEIQNKASTIELRPPPPLVKGEENPISIQPSNLRLSLSEEETQMYTLQVEENLTEETVHHEGQTAKESKETEPTLDVESQIYTVNVAESLEACRKEAKPPEQETLEDFMETDHMPKEDIQTMLPQTSPAAHHLLVPGDDVPTLTAMTISNHSCAERSGDAVDNLNLKEEWKEEKVSPAKEKTCRNTCQDSRNDATQGEVPQPPLVKDADKTGEKGEEKEGRKKGRKEKKHLNEEENLSKTTSQALEDREASIIQLPEEGVSSTLDPEKEEGGAPKKDVSKRNWLPKEKEELAPPRDHENTVDQAHGRRRGVKQQTAVPAEALEPKSRNTRRKTGPIDETERQLQPTPFQAQKRMKKSISEITANEPPVVPEAPTLTRRTRARRGFTGPEEEPKEVAVLPKRNRKSLIAEKSEVEEEAKEPQNLEEKNEGSSLGTGEMRDKPTLKRRQVGVGTVEPPREKEEDKGPRTRGTAASSTAEEHITTKSQETVSGRETRKRGPTRPTQEEGAKPAPMDANVGQKRRCTRVAAALAATNSRRRSREAVASSLSEESEVSRERARRESSSSKSSLESLESAQALPVRRSQRQRLTATRNKEDMPSTTDWENNSRSSSRGSTGKQDQGLASSSQGSLTTGRRGKKQSTASSEGGAEDVAVVTPKEETTPRRVCRVHGLMGSPRINRGQAMPKVMFTGVIDEDGEQVVRRLGGKMAESVHECTHLVTDRVRRTVKFLCALARGIPIVTLDWLEKCGRKGYFVCPYGSLVKDAEQEQNFSFSLSGSLQRAFQGRLFKGYEIHVTPNVKPEPEHMKEIIQCSGAKFLPRMPRTYKAKRVVVSCPEDLAMCKPAFDVFLPVVHTEFMLTGILQQVVDLQAYALAPATNTQESASKRSSKPGGCGR